MTLTILTTCNGPDWEQVRQITVPAMIEYADRHGYDFDMLNGEYMPELGHIVWQKIRWIRDWLAGSSVDYVWVVDLDILITNHTIPLTDFLDATYTIHMAKDVSGNLNCGSFLLKNCEQALRWLDSILSLQSETTSEQHAILELHKAPLWSGLTNILPHPSLNSTRWELYPSLGRQSVEDGQWEPGHLLCHQMAMTTQARAEIFAGMLGSVIR